MDLGRHLQTNCSVHQFPTKVCADGFSYERAYILQWFARGHTTSPKTNLVLPCTSLLPNLALRGVIQDLKGKMSALQQKELDNQQERLHLEDILDAATARGSTMTDLTLNVEEGHQEKYKRVFTRVSQIHAMSRDVDMVVKVLQGSSA